MSNNFDNPSTTSLKVKTLCINGGVSWVNDAFATCLGKTVAEVETVRNKLIKKADGSSFFKYGSVPTTVTFTVAETTHTRECVSTDTFALIGSPALFYWVYDKNFPKKLVLQSEIAVNSNWADSIQKLYPLLVESGSGVIQGQFAGFADGKYEISLPTTAANIGTNITMNLLLM